MKVTKDEFKQIIKEETSALNVALDVAGFIPGYGEIADVINALDYVRKGDYLFAALSLLSVVPTLGDVAGKGTKYAIMTARATKGVAAKATPKALKALKITNRAQRILQNSSKLINDVFDKAEGMDNEELKGHLPNMRTALNDFMSPTSTPSTQLEVKRNNTMKLTGDKLKELIREAVDDLESDIKSTIRGTMAAAGSEDEIEDEVEERLLDAIKRLTKGVEGLDLSMDFLSAAMTGEHPLSIGVGQKTLGRHRAPKPMQMKEYLDEVIEEELRKIFKEEQ